MTVRHNDSATVCQDRMTLKHIPDRAVWPWRANAVQSGEYNFFLLKLPWQPTNSHGQLPHPPFLFLLLRLLSNIQEGMYWNNNSILSLAERSGVESSSRCMNSYPQGWQPPEPTLPDLLSSREKSTPKKTISTIKEWATCFKTYISLIYGFANQHMFQIFWLTHRSSWELAASVWMRHGSATMLISAERPRPALVHHGLWLILQFGHYISLELLQSQSLKLKQMQE